MRQLQEIGLEKQTMNSIVQLTSAFEGIASAHIARIKDQVQKSELFFSELWPIYTSLRVGKEFRHGRTSRSPSMNKELVIIITSEGSLSGDIDIRLVERVLKLYEPSKYDIVAIGRHGATLLRQRNVPCKKVIPLPDQDSTLDVEQILELVQAYSATRVYYQAYLSLMNQEIKNISLSAAVQERGEHTVTTDNQALYITDINYIFEPSVEAVVGHMERSMLGVALNEVILESRLAQQASRFRAMSAAHTKARESRSELAWQFNHANRALKDERTREIINTLRKRSTTR
jgi:ATP synthase F1 gamma subunit